VSKEADILEEDGSKSWMHCIANRGKMNDWKAEVGRRCEAKVEVKKQGAQLEVLSRLREDIRRVETVGRLGDVSRVSSGFTAIDRLLPEGGYSRGILVQWLTGGGLGADYLSLVLAKQACQNGGALVVADPFNQFYPPAAAAIGINLDHLVVLRGKHVDRMGSQGQTDFFWSLDQALRCSGVAAVWGPLGKVGERWFRRFQLSAEASGCLGIFVQPLAVLRQPSWAEVQWVVSDGVRRTKGEVARPIRVRQPHVPADGRADILPSLRKDFRTRQKLRLQLTRCRGTQTGKSINLSIDAITGSVDVNRVKSELVEKSRGSEVSPFKVGEHGELQILGDSSLQAMEKLGSGAGA
jgi:protein ImuA